MRNAIALSAIAAERMKMIIRRAEDIVLQTTHTCRHNEASIDINVRTSKTVEVTDSA